MSASSCLRPLRDLRVRASASRAAKSTFSRDIAPIIFEVVHALPPPGRARALQPDVLRGGAAARHADRAGDAAAASCRRGKSSRPSVTSSGQRPLTDAEIASIERWAAGGTPPGDPKHLPPLPSSRMAGCSAQPDLIVKPARAVHVAGPADRRVPHLRDPCSGVEADLRDAASSSIPATRASCITRTSASIARTRRASSTRPIRCRATTG